jgi:hypothetical protein
VTSSFAAPEARFLNGVVAHSGNTALVADSIAGVIWQVDPRAKTVKLWLRDAALAQQADAKEFRPGANGLKRQGSRLLISNSSLRHIATVRVDSKGAAQGAVTILAKTGPIDDFLITSSGDVLFATHGPSLKRLTKGGAIDTVLASGCDGCTAVERFTDARNRKGIAVLTTGNLREGGKEPARVLFIPKALK